MVFNYYHNYPICPQCFEPSISGGIIECLKPDDFCEHCEVCGEFCDFGWFNEKKSQFNDLFHCESCDSVFYKYIDLSPFENTLSANDNFIDYDNKVPLFWAIEPNLIEKSYLNWIKKTNGKYLITWPWNEVKFTPILAFEYIHTYPTNTVVIIDNLSKDNFNKPSSYDLFNSLLYSSNNVNIDDSLKKDMDNFSRNNLFRKINKFKCHINIKKNKYGFENSVHDFSKVFTNDYSLTQFNREIIQKIKDKYGENSIRKNKVGEYDKSYYTDENGFIDVIISREFSWAGDIRKFDKKQFWENIVNIPNLNAAKQNVSHINISSEEEVNENLGYQLYFISYDLENLFELINKIGPNLVIFTDSDYFIKNFSFNYSNDYLSFSNFLKNTKANCLLFSNFKDFRHLYYRNNFINNHELVLHTWDSNDILEEIDDVFSQKTLGSSSFEKETVFDCKLKYIEVNELADFEEFIHDNGKNMDSSYFKYLLRLIHSPLLPFSDNYWLNLRLKNNITFEVILNGLEYVDDVLCAKLYNFYSDIYDGDNNPIFMYILNELDEVSIKYPECNINIILNWSEIKQFELLLEYKNVNLPDSVEILSWNQMKNIGEYNKNTVVIATSYPYDFDLYDSNFKEIIFISPRKFLEKIKTIVENRINPIYCRPLDYNVDNDYPILLKQILNSDKVINSINQNNEKNSINISDIYDIDEFIEQKELIKSNSIEKDDVDALFSDISIINKSQYALLFLDESNNGFFTPQKFNMMVYDDIDGINLMKTNLNDLSEFISKNILINRKVFFKQYKELFIKFIVKIDDFPIFSINNVSWNNFHDLVNSVFDWRNEINNVLNILTKELILRKDAIFRLTYKLADSNTLANNHDYIEKNWLSEPSFYLNTNYGRLNVYDIESPKGNFDDLLEIFRVLSEYDVGIDFKKRAFINYEAITIFKKIRLSFLIGNLLNDEYAGYYTKFLPKLRDLLNKQEFFKVQDVKLVQLKKSVSPFKVFNNPKNYY